MTNGHRVLAAIVFAALIGAQGLPSTAETPRPSATPSPTVNIYPGVTAGFAATSPVTTAQCEQEFAIACYEPAQIRAAYDLGPLLGRGISGAHQAIAIVDAFGSPTIASDLHTFDQAFGLPAPPKLEVIRPAGAIPAFDAGNPTMIAWATETTLDVEWAHVMAPQAAIVLVETPVAETQGVTGFPQIVTAENYVIDHHMADVISQSFQAAEPSLPSLRALSPLRTSFLNAERHGVTVLAAAGDTGATNPTDLAGSLSSRPITAWPPSDPLVTAVGGTQLHLDAMGGRTAPDNVWNDGGNSHFDQLFFGNRGPEAVAGGGGKSMIFERPSYQHSVSKVVGRSRGVPDISMSAACDGAVEIYESFPGIGVGWYLSCGTSESVPLFAGIVALADQEAGHGLGLINPKLYELATDRSGGITDITSGNNSVAFHQNGVLVSVPGYSARPGYDLASGVGTVDAARFVPALAGTDHCGKHGEGHAYGLCK